jgi:tripartite-type tricarboxylate transporter receptor subunit TctC
VTPTPYTPNEDFVTVARVNTAAPVLIVRDDSEFQTWEDLVAFGTENPGELDFGHSGNWGAFMVPGLALMQEAGITANLIPYQGGGPALQALLAGDVDFTFAFASTLVGEESDIEGVPTSAELGYETATAIGIMHRPVLAPAGVPEERLAILRDAFIQLNEDPTFLALMDRLGENNDMMEGAAYDELRMQQAQAYQELVESFSQ